MMNNTQTQFRNLTPHSISIVVGETTIAVEPSGEVARVLVTQQPLPAINGIPVSTNRYGEVEGMPVLGDNEIAIVSGLVLGRLDPAVWSGRAVAPDTGRSAVRNDAGQVVAVTQLVGL